MSNDVGDVVFGRRDCLFTVVALLCVGFKIYVFDVENPPFVVVAAEEMVDFSAIWNCKPVGGDDLPVGVTRRMEDGVEPVVDVVTFEWDDDEEFLIAALELSI